MIVPFSGFARLLADPAFAFLREEYLSELGRVGKIHAAGGKKRAGDWTGLFRRVMLDHFIQWLPVVREDGSIGKIHQPPQKPDDPDEFVMAAHEAVKRQRRPVGAAACRCRDCQQGQGPLADFKLDELPPEYGWLRACLAWRGLPCFCNHRDVVEHLAVKDRVRITEVIESVLVAAAECVRYMERHGAIEVPITVARSASRRHMDRRTREGLPSASELARLPRVYEPDVAA